MAAGLGIPKGGGPAHTVDVVDSLDALRDDWTRLSADSRNVFATWEWNELWWRHYGGDRRLRIAVVRRADGDAEAIVPLFLWSGRPVRTLRLLGHGHGDRLGPICRDGTGAAEQAMRSALAEQAHDVFVGDWVAGDRDWAGVLGGRVVRRTGYPILQLQEDSWAAFLAARSKRFRKSVRHAHNRLLRDHDVRFRFADEATIERDLDCAFRLHRARFQVHPGCLFCGEHEAFQRAFANAALERGWLRLLLLELDGEPVGLEYGFLFAGAYFAYQGGRDRTWDRLSVGFLLEVESIRLALEEGATEYRFLGGEEDYKYRYPTEDPRLETVVAAGTRRGRAAAAALAGAWRLPGGEALLRRVGST
ncbi:MAG TPA: GNAT family N-acetyltransferase [Gaiellaceae bacterium]|nr:GNAT family N-acetyltransferase [Gaiellaceae bacterium]